MSYNNSCYKKNGSSSASSDNESIHSSALHPLRHTQPSQQQHPSSQSNFSRDFLHNGASSSNRKECDQVTSANNHYDDELRRVYIRPPPNRLSCEAVRNSYHSSKPSSSSYSLSSCTSPSSSSSSNSSPFSDSTSLSSTSLGSSTSSSRKWSPFFSNSYSNKR